MARNRDTKGEPLSRGLSAADIITKAVGKKSYSEVNEEDIYGLATKEGFSKRDTKRIVKGFRNLDPNASLELSESGSQFNVFPKDAPGADASSRSTGNKKGFQAADLIGLGSNVNRFAGLAKKVMSNVPAEAEKKTATGPTIEGTPVATGTTIDNWWKTDNNLPPKDNIPPKDDTSKTEWGKSNVPSILHPNEDNSKLKPSFGNLDGGFQLQQGLKKSGVSRLPADVEERFRRAATGVGFGGQSVFDQGLYDEYVEMYQSNPDAGSVIQTKSKDHEKVVAARTAEAFLMGPAGRGASIVGGRVLAPAASWIGSKASIPAKALIKRAVNNKWVPEVAKDLKFVKKAIKGAKATKEATKAATKEATKEATKKVVPGPFSPNVAPNFQSGLNPVKGMKPNTFDRMTEYTDEATDAFSNWLKQMKKGGKVPMGQDGIKTKINYNNPANASSIYDAMNGKYFKTPQMLMGVTGKPVMTGKRDIIDRYDMMSSIQNSADEQMKLDKEEQRAANFSVANQVGNETANKIGLGEYINPKRFERKSYGLKNNKGVSADQLMNAGEALWSVGYPELMKRKLKMEKEGPRNINKVELGAMPEQDLPFRPEKMMTTPNQRNMTVDQAGMLNFAKSVDSENARTGREWGYQNAAQKLQTRKEGIETKNREKLFNAQREDQDFNQLNYRNLQREMYNQQTMKEIGQGTYANVLKNIREPRTNAAAEKMGYLQSLIESQGTSDEMRAWAEGELKSKYVNKKKKGGKLTASSLIKSK